MYTTLGAPSGARGASKGVQSGSESRMSTLMTPLNGLLTSTTIPGSCRSDDCLLPASHQTYERHHPNQMIRVDYRRFTLIG
jgi:hypothetical protein